MDRLVTTKDPLLAKIVRNFSQWTLALQQVRTFVNVTRKEALV